MRLENLSQSFLGDCELTVHEGLLVARHPNLKMSNSSLFHKVDILLRVRFSNKRPETIKSVSVSKRPPEAPVQSKYSQNTLQTQPFEIPKVLYPRETASVDAPATNQCEVCWWCKAVINRDAHASEDSRGCRS